MTPLSNVRLYLQDIPLQDIVANLNLHNDKLATKQLFDTVPPKFSPPSPAGTVMEFYSLDSAVGFLTELYDRNYISLTDPTKLTPFLFMFQNLATIKNRKAAINIADKRESLPSLTSIDITKITDRDVLLNMRATFKSISVVQFFNSVVQHNVVANSLLENYNSQFIEYTESLTIDTGNVTIDTGLITIDNSLAQIITSTLGLDYRSNVNDILNLHEEASYYTAVREFTDDFNNLYKINRMVYDILLSQKLLSNPSITEVQIAKLKESFYSPDNTSVNDVLKEAYSKIAASKFDSTETAVTSRLPDSSNRYTSISTRISEKLNHLATPKPVATKYMTRLTPSTYKDFFLNNDFFESFVVQ